MESDWFNRLVIIFFAFTLDGKYIFVSDAFLSIGFMGKVSNVLLRSISHYDNCNLRKNLYVCDVNFAVYWLLFGSDFGKWLND